MIISWKVSQRSMTINVGNNFKITIWNTTNNNFLSRLSKPFRYHNSWILEEYVEGALKDLRSEKDPAMGVANMMICVWWNPPTHRSDMHLQLITERVFFFLGHHISLKCIKWFLLYPEIQKSSLKIVANVDLTEYYGKDWHFGKYAY